MVDNIGSGVDSRGRSWNRGGAGWRGTGRQHHLVIIIILGVTIVRIIIIIIIIKSGACRQHHLILEDHHQVKFLVIEEKNNISKPNPPASMCVWMQHFVWFGLVSDILERINDERFAHRHQRAYDCNISFGLFCFEDHHPVEILEGKKGWILHSLASTCVWMQHFAWFDLVSDILEGINDDVSLTGINVRKTVTFLGLFCFVLKITTQLRF